MTTTDPQVTADSSAVYPVKRKRSHIRKHGDEALANEIGNKFGDDRLPGFATAPMMLVDSGLHLGAGKTGWDYLRDGTACLGVYGGPFDEHGDAVFGKSNCALKMARFVGVDRDPALKDILAYSLRSDRDSYRGPFDIDPIMKEWWRSGRTLDEIVGMYHHIFLAWYHKFSGHAPVGKPVGTFRNAIARWMVNRFGAANPNLNSLLEKLRTGKQVADKFHIWDHRGITQTFNLDLRRSGKIDFDLEGVWDCLWAAGTPADIIANIMEMSLEAKYQEQVKFALAQDEFRAKAKYLPSNKRHPYKVAVIESDSDYINRAAHHDDRGLDVLIMCLSSGHYRTFNLHKRLNLNHIAARIRELDILKLDGRHSLAWQYLESKGTLPEVPAWYNSHDDLGVFNSTETSPNTSASPLAKREVVGCYDEGLVHVWKTYHTEPAAQENKRIELAKERRRHEKQQRAAS